MSQERKTKDKAMASRLKGDAKSGTQTSTNGVDKFTCYKDAEYRGSCACSICHKQVSLTGYDTHLRAHMAGGSG